ncbi:hypothetical protein BDN72DRAFT_845879 [Pluteus cervinus]|uniref:Uncharacterized protein n=1 Tax=Pluteus cervinus TaxID=181527 RepID=A0ACD3AI38_9AGAR|nr:hypothetical protein BDN72DRAFT_845879 [Pluteus cervinus]
MDRHLEATHLTTHEIRLELAALKEHIRLLHSQLNAPEVLTEIFSWVQLLHGNIFERCFDPRAFARWVKIGISSRTLWSIIPVHNRSGSVPLIITNCNDFDLTRDDQKLWQQILAASQRIRILHIRCGRRPQVESFDKAFPLLIDLHVSSGMGVPRALLSRSLNRLSLNSCDFEWDHLGLDGLTSLEIIKPGQKISLDAFILLLKNLPQLASLELGSVFTEPDPEAQNTPLSELMSSPLPSSALYLPALSFFKVHNSSSPAYIQLLALIQLQPEFVLDLAFNQQVYNDRDLVLVLGILNRVVRSSSMKIRAVRCYSGGFQAYRTVSFILSSNNRLKSPFITLRVGLPMSNIKYSRWLEELAPFPLDDVEFLSTERIINRSGWENNVFTGLPNLRHLQLLDYGDVLLEYLIDDSRSSIGPVSFPALQELEIHDIRFSKEFKSSVPSCVLRRTEMSYHNYVNSPLLV